MKKPVSTLNKSTDYSTGLFSGEYTALYLIYSTNTSHDDRTVFHLIVMITTLNSLSDMSLLN